MDAPEISTEAEALTVAGFDLEKVTDMIDNSELPATQKLLLSSALQKAQDDPEVLQATLVQLRNALGFE